LDTAISKILSSNVGFQEVFGGSFQEKDGKGNASISFALGEASWGAFGSAAENKGIEKKNDNDQNGNAFKYFHKFSERTQSNARPRDRAFAISEQNSKSNGLKQFSPIKS
jgi:hypothetical protein